MVAGCLGFALSGSWPLALAAALVGGLGFGERGAAMLNVLNAFSASARSPAPAVSRDRLLTLSPGAAPYAYAGVGLFIAPVFPTGLPWLNRALPQSTRAGAWVIAASMLGGVAAPPLLGVGIEASGIHAVPWLLTALSAASLIATLWLIRLTRTGSGAPCHDIQTT
jgi:fucose permease